MEPIPRFRVVLWDKDFIEAHPRCDSGERDYWVEFAWRHDLKCRITPEEKLRGQETYR